MAGRRARRPPLGEADLVAVLRERAQRWTDMPNVTSVGVGYALRRGKRTRRLAVQVTVAKKLGELELRRQGIAVLPRTIRTSDGRRVAVDVVQRCYKPSYQLVAEPRASFTAPPIADDRIRRRRRLPRVVPGVSVGHEQLVSAGTIGAIVYDNQTGAPCLLSNAHIFAPPGAQAGEAIVQPGRNDDAGVARNRAGTLLRAHVGLAGDCAIARIEGRLFDERVLALGVAPRRLAKVAIGDRLVKSGRTTGITHGVVVRVGVVFGHDYGPGIGVKQIGGFEIGFAADQPPAGGNLSDGGDSGSLWLVEEAGVVTDIAAGLHFAEQDDPESGREHALACGIHSVFDTLDISFQAPG